ncbi:FtsB family cell division protein [Schaalia cardiffensis]
MASSPREGRPHAPRRPNRTSGAGRSHAGAQEKDSSASGSAGRRRPATDSGQASKTTGVSSTGKHGLLQAFRGKKPAGRGGAADGHETRMKEREASKNASASSTRKRVTPQPSREMKRDTSTPITPEKSDPKERLERARALRERRNAPSSRERPVNGPRPVRQSGKGRSQKKEKAPRREHFLSKGESFELGGQRFSVRWLSFILLLGVVMVLLVPKLYVWMKQEEELRSITIQVQLAQQRNAEMQEKLELWNDPEFIASQARERLGYVKPGETQYTVVDPGEGYQDLAQVAAAAVQGPARPWLQVVAILLEEADHAKIDEDGHSDPAAQSGAADSSETDSNAENTQEDAQ